MALKRGQYKRAGQGVKCKIMIFRDGERVGMCLGKSHKTRCKVVKMHNSKVNSAVYFTKDDSTMVVWNSRKKEWRAYDLMEKNPLDRLKVVVPYFRTCGYVRVYLKSKPAKRIIEEPQPKPKAFHQVDSQEQVISIGDEGIFCLEASGTKQEIKTDKNQ